MSDQMTIEGIDHVAIHTPRIDATIRFYERVLDLKCGARADFKFPGAWLYADGRALVHLVDTSKTVAGRTEGAGALDHVAFLAGGFEATRLRIAQQGIWSDVREKTADGVKRIFLRDPNGVLIELNFRMSRQL